MPKSKKLTPAEEYSARKAREDVERSAVLPPGLINHANTCFFNSTLQALMATPLLEDLLLFHPNSMLLDPTRSPALTNGRRLEDTPQKVWEEGMPIADAFLEFISNAWSKRQLGPQKVSLPTKSVLGPLGAKYVQYLDFRQQDAHELLRHLLDGIHMEEYDSIKRHQSSQNHKTAGPTHSSSLPGSISSYNSHTLSKASEDDQPSPFPDMVFGGKLASIIVCETCKHVSHTYEDFMDLSLPIKYDEAKDRKRDRLKALAQRFSLSSTFGQNNSPRAHSVPRVPIVKRSSTPGVDSAPVSADEDDPPPKAKNDKPGSGSKEDHGASGSAPAADDKAISGRARKVSLQFRMNRGKSKEGLAQSSKSTDERVPTDHAEGHRTPKTDEPPDEKHRLSPFPARALSTRLMQRSVSQTHHPKAPKIPSGEAAYLAAILRDDYPSQHNPLTLLHSTPTFHGGTSNSAPSTLSQSAQPTWFKFSPTQDGLVECLRRFTAVESLDGENSFACRSCWKIVNPNRAQQKGNEKDSSSSSDDEADERDSEDEEIVIVPRHVAQVTSAPPPPPSPPEGDTDLATALKKVPSTSAISTYSETASNTGADLTASIMSAPSTFPPSLHEDDSSHSGPTVSITTYRDSIPTISTTPPAEASVSFPSTSAHSIVQKPSVDPSIYLSPNASRESLPGHNSGQHSKQATSSESGDDVDVISSVSGANSETSSLAGDSPKEQPRVEDVVSKPNKSAVRSKQVILRRALKRYLIAVPPPILVIHLKRFQQLSKAPVSLFGNFKKIDDFVPFPEYLDLRPFIAPNRADYGLGKRGREEGKEKHWNPRKQFNMDHVPNKEPVLYRLYAIVVHIGNMLGGHYIAYTALHPSTYAAAKKEDNPSIAPSGSSTSSDKADTKTAERQWCHVSDKEVRLASLEEVLAAKAYICFYERI